LFDRGYRPQTHIWQHLPIIINQVQNSAMLSVILLSPSGDKHFQVCNK